MRWSGPGDLRQISACLLWRCMRIRPHRRAYERPVTQHGITIHRQGSANRAKMPVERRLPVQLRINLRVEWESASQLAGRLK
jgi:hypothetical protein